MLVCELTNPVAATSKLPIRMSLTGFSQGHDNTAALRLLRRNVSSRAVRARVVAGT
jgi:hypothetical protein